MESSEVSRGADVGLGRQTFLIRSLLILILLAVGVSYAESRKHFGNSAITVDFPDPIDTVLQVTRDVVGNGSITGSSQYADQDHIENAFAAQSSKLFNDADVPPGAKVLYKVAERVAAPRHFENSTDVGTVAVRYILEKVSDDKTRVTIESKFVEDSHHGHHPSDGSVETCEFVVIEAKLKVIEDQLKEAKEAKEHAAERATIEDLQRKIDREQDRYDSLNSEVDQLRKRARQLHQLTQAKVKSAAAELKAGPYTHAETLQPMTAGEQVTVLFRAPAWCRIRTSAGKEGWIYQPFLESAQ